MAKRIRSSTSSKETEDVAAALAIDAEAASASGRPVRVRPASAAATTAAAAKGKGKPAAATSASAPNSKPSTPVDGSNKHVMLPAFLSKTYEIFCMQEFANVCGWNSSGDTIIVSQLEAFVAMVLPRFFKHRNFPSFVRQLNLYGFHKTVLDSKRLEFQHPCFKRDRPDLLHLIKRKVSSHTSSSQQQQQQQQQLVNASIQNSRFEAHREMSDALLREMKELRNRSEAMEKRLRELEIDNAIVRSDNLKLWKHLGAAKDKQLIMQEKMKKIMWILYQIYRNKQGLPKLSSNEAATAITEDYDNAGLLTNSNVLGPKEFRDVLRFLAMDEPPMLPRSTSSAVGDATHQSRKRKFLEVPVSESFGSQLYDLEPSSVVEVGSPLRTAPTAVPPTDIVPVGTPSESLSNALSLFSPAFKLPKTDQSSSASSIQANTSIVPTPSLNRTFSSDLAKAIENGSINSITEDSSPTENTQLDFIDDDLPLLSDSEHDPFAEGEEQQVMKKLEDFETSLLDEYDVGCLDTLLQQLKSANGEKPAAPLAIADPEEVFVGVPDEEAAHRA